MMKLSLSVFASLALLFLLCFLTSSSSVTAQHALFKYPSLRCSACKATAEILGDRMNETSDPKKTILTSHRLDKHERRTSYADSELRGYDLIEKLCDDNNFGSYMLREEKRTGLRIFSREAALQQVMPYDDKDRKELHDTMASKFLGRYCNEVIEEYEEDIVKMIKKHKTLAGLTDALCSKKAKVCSGKVYDKGVKADLARRAAWRKRTGIRTGTDVDNDDRAKAEKAKNEADGLSGSATVDPTEVVQPKESTKNSGDVAKDDLADMPQEIRDMPEDLSIPMEN